jgi:hypothetical protein
VGVFRFIAKKNLFIRYSQISAVEKIKLILGFQHDLIISSTYGGELDLKAYIKMMQKRQNLYI